jgi:hypothetical protein
LNSADELVWLQNWYLNNCDGLWEHPFVVRIGTLDYPGWKLSIGLRGTDLAGQAFRRMKVERAGKWLGSMLGRERGI